MEQDEPANGVVDQVDDVVQPNRQPVDVVAIDRRHEGAVDPAEDVVGDLVALVLERLDAFGDAGKGLLAHEEPIEDEGALLDVFGQGREALEVLVVLRQKAEHGPPSEAAPSYRRTSGRLYAASSRATSDRYATAGKRTWNLLPCPTSPSTSTAAPWSWAMCLTIARPRPEPGRTFERERSTW